MSELLDLHAYVDGELSEEAAAAIRGRIESDPAAAAEVAAIRKLKELSSQCAGTVSCEETWKCCTGRLDELDRVKRTERFVGRYAWGLCAVVLFALIGAGMFNRAREGGAIYAADVASIASSATGEATLASPDGLTGWLTGLFGRAPVQEPPSQLRVLSMARANADGRAVARVELADAKGPVVLLIVDGATDVRGLAPADSIFQHGRMDCVNCVSWTSDRAAMILAGDRPYEALEEIARQIQVQ